MEDAIRYPLKCESRSGGVAELVGEIAFFSEEKGEFRFLLHPRSKFDVDEVEVEVTAFDPQGNKLGTDTILLKKVSPANSTRDR